MNDDDKKATEGSGEKATNGAAKARDAASVAGTLKHLGGSQSDNWNAHIADQAFWTIWPSKPADNERRERQRDIVIAGLTGIGRRMRLKG